MRLVRWFPLVALLLLAAIPVVAQHGGRARPGNLAEDGWPRTPAGTMARGWVSAFSTGEEAMKAFHREHLAEASLKRRGLDARVETYRRMREQYGKLILGSIKASKPHECTASLLDSGAKTHTFVFKVESRAPHKLLSVGVLQHGHGHGMFGH